MGTTDIPYLPTPDLSLIYVNDVAQLFAEATTAPQPQYHAYNTGGLKITTRELASIVEEELGGTVDCAENPDEELRPLLVSSETNDRAMAEFAYEPTPLRTALRSYAAALEER